MTMAPVLKQLKMACSEWQKSKFIKHQFWNSCAAKKQSETLEKLEIIMEDLASNNLEGVTWVVMIRRVYHRKGWPFRAQKCPSTQLDRHLRTNVQKDSGIRAAGVGKHLDSAFGMFESHKE